MLQEPDFSMIVGIKAITEKIEPYLQHRLKRKIRYLPWWSVLRR
ncbi:MAG: hypothetical protein ACI35P_07320 [Bacillus sp. (in: firmicutes)]